jgi:hypothetical protein
MKKPEKPSKGDKPVVKLKIKVKAGSPEAAKAAVKKIVK